MDKKDVLSPTVSMGSTYITSVIDAKPSQDVGTCNIPNAFVQTKMDPTEKHGDHIIMKLRGVLVYILSEWTMFNSEYEVKFTHRRIFDYLDM